MDEFEKSDQNLCRICQSETGVMVRPCCCDGSVGTIHEKCLNQWYEHSGKDHCEICLTKYARTERILKPVSEWTRPKIDRSFFYSILAIICVSISLYKMILLFVQRQSYERFVLSGISPRTHDYGRITIMVILLCSLLGVILTMTINTVLYVRKQCIVRFTEHEKHKVNKKKRAF
ncbi:Zinc finger domain containing protein [Aphelenchoides bicaudatus]|nr:Zinc finger domain containing protein [Aphelenchoides bicaudatus]